MQSNFENDSRLYNPRLYRRSGCVLQADGIGFGAEEYLRQTSFDPKLILYWGKLGFPEKFKLKIAEVNPSELELFKTTFLVLELSQAEAKTSQISEATSFFKQYRDELRRLQSFPQVENIMLTFMAAEGEHSTENLPDQFMELALGSGVTSLSL
jgi:hypothetical protein